MFLSVARVSSVGRALVLHAELHHGTVLGTPLLLAITRLRGKLGQNSFRILFDGITPTQCMGKFKMDNRHLL